MMNKGVSRLIRQTSILRRVPRASLQWRYSTPQRRYSMAPNKEKGRTNNKNRLEIDLIASSCGLIATLIAIYFITPKMESKKPIKSKVKMEISKRPFTNDDDDDFTPPQNKLSLSQVKPQGLDLSTVQTNDSPEEEKPNTIKEPELHMELEEIIVPGDVNIINLHGTPSHYIHKEERVELDKESGEVQRDITVEESTVDNKKKLSIPLEHEIMVPQGQNDSLACDVELSNNDLNERGSILEEETWKGEEKPQVVNELGERVDSRETISFESEANKEPMSAEMNSTPALTSSDSKQEALNSIITEESPNNSVNEQDNSEASNIPNSENGTKEEVLERHNTADSIAEGKEEQQQISPDIQVLEPISKSFDPEEDSAVIHPNTSTEIPDEIWKEGHNRLLIQTQSSTEDNSSDETVIIPNINGNKVENNTSPNQCKNGDISTETDHVCEIPEDLPLQETPLSLTDEQVPESLPHNVLKEASDKVEDAETNDSIKANLIATTSKDEYFNKEREHLIGMENLGLDLNEKLGQNLNEKEEVLMNKIETVISQENISPITSQANENSLQNEATEAQNTNTKEEERAYNPDTGEINWDCPCLGGLAQGPCGEEFKLAFSCFVYSTKEPKGNECLKHFHEMQNCFQKHPDFYLNNVDNEDTQTTDEGTTV